MTTRPLTTLAALCLAAVMLVGCKAAPRTLAESSGERLEAGDYWSARGDARLGAPASGSRVVLAEVVVEFVTSKNQAGERSQAAFIPPHPVFLAANAAGVGRKNVEFGDEQFRQIADRVAGALVAELRARGHTVITPEQAAASSALVDLERLAAGEHDEVREINLAATDTGRVRSMRRVPALGTRIITADPAEIDAAAGALRSDLDADAVLRASIRVGVYLERASLEEGSRIWLGTPGAGAELAARRSLLSDEPVLDESSGDSDWTVSPGAYLEAIDATAPAFIGMALDALD